ncbi:GNAT family N-acetyltransferase [Desulfosporosinus sp. BICA1-9]|uniref:GNAT family N-acetyltransferase n=1 Tax=Desulfosporosinus sp. BICA1-9 TaxID=1531958 RepID=UPI00054C7301|nr:GNAT family protein [Desulfosporosinus sp. BICA1-9]KJS48140.1 MAG: acetyltransferase [Peptococcaceae bacterium BRH_c23]KJS78394.1 MAG: acetyltransferase [Desulfosporosinus sp. BICA1-9]HBW36560.1 N-acetyltransferase [Desulfosporosinus sp.]
MLKGLKTSIRPIEEDDLDEIYQWYNDQEVNLWSSGAWPLNTLQSKDQLAVKFLDESPDTHRYIILDENERLIGTIGFKEINIPARSVALFVVIGDKNYWGKAYGTDAVITFARYLFSQWNFHRISLDTWDQNIRAIKAYEKVGFVIEGRQREARYVLGNYHDAILMGLLREEFLALHGKI